jgi:uncharacterized protein involved in oxidation of intracellular sulfur
MEKGANAMQVLILLNDAPYGSERSYQGLRLADALLQVEEDLQLTVYLLGDAVACAKRGQQTPDGFYNLERMLRPVLRRGTVMVCKTCAAARGLVESDLVEGARLTPLGELAQLTLEADKVLTF